MATGKKIAVSRAGKELAPAGFREKLQAMAKEQSSLERAGSDFVKTKGSKFEFKGAVIKPPLKVVVLGYTFENAFYVGDYDPDNKTAPVCFAISDRETDMAPHDTSPEKQSEKCQGCPQNEWGSADKGKGKACKNQRRLLLMSVPTDKAGDVEVDKLTPEFVENAEVAQLRISPTGIRGWAGYVKQVTNTLGAPLFAVVTAFSFDESVDYPLVVPALEMEITDMGVIQALMDKAQKNHSELHTPYDVSGYAPPVQIKKNPVKGTKPVKPAAKRS